MKIKAKIFLMLSLTLMLAIFIQPALSANVTTVNILQPADVKNTFSPTASGQNGYYILNAGTSYSGISYENSKASGQFTLPYMYSNSYSGTTSSIYSNKGTLDQSFTSNSPLTTPNPFLQANTSYNIPNVVQISNNNSNLGVTETAPFSLHIDKTMTFFAQANKPYIAVLTESSNLLLDVNVKDSNANVDAYLYNFNTNQFDYFYSFSYQNTVPVFNTNNNNDTYVFKFVPNTYPNSDTLITVTPHKLSTSDYASVNLKVNTSSSWSVSQGSCEIKSNNYDLTSFNTFKFDVTNGNYYQIYFDTVQPDTKNVLCNVNNNGGSVVPTLLNSTTDFNYQSGSLNQNGYNFQATSNGTISMLVQSTGYLRRDLTVFFRQISKPEQIPEVPLTLNANARLVTGDYNTFTISAPSVLAINQTNTASTSSYPGLPFYRYNSSTTNWDSLGYSGSAIYGNLVTFNNANLQNTNWIYVPSGTYAVKPTNSLNDQYNYHFTFNVLNVNQISSTGSQTFNVNNNTIFAVQYNRNNFQFNQLNLTSSTHDNITMRYEVRMVNKFSDYSPSLSSTIFPTTTYLGNRLTTTGWVQYGTNSTILYNQLKLTDPDVPIFIIHPYYAWNVTTSLSMSSFNTQVTVKAQTLSTNTDTVSKMIHSGVVTGSTSVPINNDLTSITQYHYFKLDVQSDTLYNITIMTFGNYSNYVGAWNISLNSFQVYNGKYYNTNLPFGSTSDYNQVMNTTDSSLFLTQSTNAYLMLSVSRNYNYGIGEYENGTISIKLNKITSNVLSFPNKIDPTTLTWNKTVSQFEVSNKNTLLSIIKPSHSTPGFEFLPLMMVLFLIPIYKKHKKAN